MKKRKIIGICMALAVLMICFTGCSSAETEDTPPQQAGNGQPDSGQTVQLPEFEDWHLTEDWDDDEAVKITFSETEASAGGAGAEISDGKVMIRKGGVYVLTGRCTEGGVEVSVRDDDRVTLVLNGVDIYCSNSAALNIINGDVHMILAEGSVNTLASGEEYEFAEGANEEPNACIFADDDISIAGKGKLTVSAGYNNGIGSKNNLRIAGGEITVEAQNNALKGNESVLIAGGELLLISEDDGIKSDGKQDQQSGMIGISGGNVEIVCKDDALQAVSLISVSDCRVAVDAGGKKLNCDGAIVAEEGCVVDR